MDTLLRGIARGLVAGIALLLLASCTGSTTGAGTGSSASSTASPSSSPTEGLHTFSGQVLGRGDYPSYTVEAPDGWSSYNNTFTVKDSGVDVMGVSVWDVGRVPLNPCQWKGTFQTPGPSVNDLVDALLAQRGRQASTPQDVTFAGYPARHLEWSVPANAQVTGESDFTGCDPWVNGHLDYIGWLGNGMGERWAQVAGQVDRMWIFKVNGQRLLVDATFSPNATAAQIDEMMSVAKSLHFN